MLVYLMIVKPFKEDLNNKLEILNEGTFYILTLLCFYFTDYVDDI